jgi:regulation of enolase protein 1 (concanavalin A-like superfamily)
MRLFVLPLLASIGWNLASAQNAEFVTENSRRAIVPWSARSSAPAPARPLSAPPSRAYHWAAFTDVPSESDRAVMAGAGIQVLGLAGRPGSYLLYKVRLSDDPDRAQEALQSLPVYVNLLPVLPEEKLPRRMLRGQFQRGIVPGRGLVKATVLFHRPHSRGEAQAILAKHVNEVIPDEVPHMFHVVASPDRLLALAELEEVARVEDYLEKLPLNDVSRALTKVNALQAPTLDTLAFPPTPAWNAGRAFTGDSIWVDVNEGVDANHLDLRENTATGSRPRLVVPGDDLGTSFHGTHVAGIVGGNGWNSELNGNGGRRYQWRGVAPKVRYISGWDAGDANNHSFIFGDQGYYGYNDANLDQATSDHGGLRQEHDNVSVWAAANNGGYGAQYGVQRGYYSMLINAKNCIKVGSVDPNGQRSGFSSMGPIRDGRIGPDVMAPGGSVLSTMEASQSYTWMGGTSMAAPHITGISALLLQKYRDAVLRPQWAGGNIHDHGPWNSTIKAVLVHTAQDMVDLTGAAGADPDFEASGFPNRSPLFGAGPDFATGYGLVDAQRAAQFVDPALLREASVTPGQTLSYNIAVPAGRSNLRVTLAWDDPGFMGANDEAAAYQSKLVNDLDLVLVSPSGTVNQPWILNHNLLNNGAIPADGIDPITPAEIQNNPAYKGKDSRGTLEVVDVASPAAGTWRIEVRGFQVTTDQSKDAGINQDFSLVSDLPLPAVTPPAGPDLVISKLTFTPSRPVAGDSVAFRATLLNRGSQATPTGVVHSVGFSDGSLRDSNLTFSQSLAPGQSVTLAGPAAWTLYSNTFVQASADYRRTIAETSERNNALSTMVAVTGIPEPWVDQDIGTVNPPGRSYFYGSSYSVQGAGTDIWGTADEFHFLHRTLNGDGEIRAIIPGLFGPDPWSKAGVMIRESTAPGSANAFMALTVGNGATFQRRTTTGGASVNTVSTGAVPQWVRLVRAGSAFTGYKSADGTNWTQVGTATISMAAQVRIGLAYTSHLQGSSSSADFAQVSFSGGVTVDLTGRIADPSDNGIAGVTVAVSAGATGTAQTDAQGNYTITGLPASGTFTVTPTHPSYSFNPASRVMSPQGLTRSADFFGTPSGGGLPSPWVAADIGAVGVAGTATHASGVFTVEGSGADIWNTADAFRFVHRTLIGDGEIRARINSIENTDVWAKAGVMMRDGLAANARNVFIAVTAASGVSFQQRATVGGASTNTQVTGLAAPYWVRLVRSGNLFSGYRSADGVTWTLQAQATLALGQTLSVGLAVTAHNNATLATGVFSSVGFTEGQPFLEADVGSVGLAGSRTVSAGAHTVKGSGADIFGTADAFHFSYLALNGDGEVRARVSSVQNTDPWAKAGVMIRENLTAGSRHLTTVLSASNVVQFQRRLTAGGATTNTDAAGFAAPYWVRIARVGNVFTSYRSPDGVTWTQVGQETLALPASVLAGLAVTSHNNSVLCTGVFDNVKVP